MAVALVTACTPAEQQVRPGPAETITFAPPAGFGQLERWVERRAVELSFPDQDTQTVVEVHAGVTEEKWQPLPEGGFRITSVVREQGATRNGVPMPLPVPIQGVAFVHRVDAQGKLVAVEDPAGTAFELQERIAERRAREMLEQLLTPEFVRERVTAGWNARTAVCGKDVVPGAESDALERQEIPVGPVVPLLVRTRALGFEEGASGRVALFASKRAGRNAAWIDAAPVQPLLDGLPEGKASLPPSAEGEGLRIVSKATCQVLRETATLKGEVPVDRKAAEAQGLRNFPTRIAFRVDRELTREPLR